jgi:hypothetical protein
MKELKERILIEQAALGGKEIEVDYDKLNKWYKINIKEGSIDEYIFNWIDHDYRIKGATPRWPEVDQKTKELFWERYNYIKKRLGNTCNGRDDIDCDQCVNLLDKNSNEEQSCFDTLSAWIKDNPPPAEKKECIDYTRSKTMCVFYKQGYCTNNEKCLGTVYPMSPKQEPIIKDRAYWTRTGWVSDVLTSGRKSDCKYKIIATSVDSFLIVDFLLRLIIVYYNQTNYEPCESPIGGRK